MSKSTQEITRIEGDELVVKSKVMEGEIVSKPSKTCITTLINTEKGKELVVKVANLDGGGGGGSTVVVDQTYDPVSTNAQSGTAVAEAVAPCLTNKATTQTGADASIILFPWNSASIAAKGSVFIGPNNGTIVTQGNHDTLVGAGPSANAANGDCTAVGYNARAAGQGSTTMGSGAAAIGQYGIAIGKESTCNESGSIAIGLYATVSSGNNAIAIGNGARTDQSGAFSGSYRIAIGTNACATAYNAIAIGSGGTNNTSAKATNKDSIQLGTGINNAAKTFQVYEYPLLDGNTGYIPADRLGTGFDATKTQVLKNVNGTLTWVDEA